MGSLYHLRVVIGDNVLVSRGGNRGGRREGESSLSIEIYPSVEDGNLARVVIQYQTGLFSLESTIANELEGLERQLYENQDVSLSDYARSALRTLSSEDRQSIAMSLPVSYNAPQEQVVMDHLLVCIGCYLALYSLLLSPEYQVELPFQFSLPHPELGLELFSANTYRYLMHILPSLSALLEGDSTRRVDYLLIQRVIEFMNVWEWLFEPGAELDLGAARNEALSGYNEVIIAKMGKLLTKEQELDEIIEKKVNAAVVAALTRSGNGRLESLIQRGVEKKSEEIASRYMKHQFTLETRISALEGYVEASSALLRSITSQHYEYQHQVESLMQGLETRLLELELKRPIL